jgi:hypothetical protein
MCFREQILCRNDTLNEPEFIANLLRDWLEQKKIKTPLEVVPLTEPGAGGF